MSSFWIVTPPDSMRATKERRDQYDPDSHSTSPIAKKAGKGGSGEEACCQDGSFAGRSLAPDTRRIVSFARIVVAVFALVGAWRAWGAPPCTLESNAPPTASVAASNGNPLLDFRVRGAQVDSPFELVFDAKDPVRVQWRRVLIGTGVSPQLRLRVEIDHRQGAADSFHPHCTVDWMPISELASFRSVRLNGNGLTTWRVRTFQQNLSPGVSVLDEDLADIAVEGNLRSKIDASPAPLPSFDSLRLASFRGLSSCAQDVDSIPPDVVVVEAAQLPRNALHVPGVIQTVGGRSLFLRIKGIEPNSSVSIRFDAKRIGYGSTSIPICTVATQPAGDKWIKATAPWEWIDNMRWTITITAASALPAIDVLLYRERMPIGQISKVDVGRFGTDVYICRRANKHEGRRGRAKRPEEAFRFAYALTVHTGLSQTGVSQQSRKEIVDAILVAVNIWRKACSKCSPYQFSILDIDGDRYVPDRMLSGEPGNRRATFASMYPWSGLPDVKRADEMLNVNEAFVKLEDDPIQRSRFCQQSDEISNRFSAARSPLCRPTTAPNAREMIVHFSWRAGDLSCPGHDIVVACWNGISLIQMNVGQISFYAGDIGKVLIGASPERADLIRVFAHEVGHWLGLGHLRSDGNMMSERYSNARCIDEVVIDEVNAIAVGLEGRSDGRESLLFR